MQPSVTGNLNSYNFPVRKYFIVDHCLFRFLLWKRECREKEKERDVNSKFTGLLNRNDNARFDKRGKWWARMNFEKIAIPAG